MSAAKHTPGPWMVSPEHPTIIRRDYRPISDCGELIGSASGHTKSGFFPSEDEAVANARLIAAAPELLEALQAMVVAQSMSSYGDPSDFIWPIQTMRKPGEHAYGYLCPSHGLGYTSTCVCCRSDYEEHSANKDRQAVGRRDAALRAAVVSSATAIAKATGAPQ